MADVIIRGMEMPRCCALCDLEHWDEDSYGDEMNHRCCPHHKGYTANVRATGRLPDCPIVPLPEGHGRLIDADACHSPEDLNNEPTIVPAEGGGEDG